MMEKILTYRALFNENSKIDAIAFVKYPAIIETFDYKELLIKDRIFELQLEGKMVTSPLLIPYQFIYRRDVEEYYVYYTEADILNASKYIVDNAKSIKFNYEHDAGRPIEGVSIVGAYVDLEGKDYIEGTLVVQLAIDNEELISNIANGSIRGLSIEGVVDVIEDGYVFGTIVDKQFKIK